jgi:hypothetical protein
MEKTNTPGQPLSPEQVSSISGGADASCPATATVGTSGASVGTTGPTPGDALIAIYEGFVEVTSHIIDRLIAK